MVPEWTERHAPDLGVTLVELLAYVGDYLSYYQDSVGTEAYLDTARQRVSIRRHARLVDYVLHEGCNARAWVCLRVDSSLELDPGQVAFITGLNEALEAAQDVLVWDDLVEEDPANYEVFEPLLADRSEPLHLLPQHNEIRFHTWGDVRCCLEKGSTSATLLDSWSGAGRALDLAPGDVLIFEEVLGPRTGLFADANPVTARRCA